MSKDTTPSLPFSRLPELLERLYDSLASFLEAKLTLFRKEIWEEGQSLVRRGLGMAGWGSCLGGIHGFDGCVGFIAGHAAR
jgi:hypothetical protein